MENSGLLRLETLRRLNKQNPEWVNQDLYRLLFKMDLYDTAYTNLRDQRGVFSKSVIGKSKKLFNLEQINEIIQKMKDESYKFSPARKIYIPKSGNKLIRPLGVPSFTDLLVQEVTRMILNVIYEPYIKPENHSSSHSALREIHKEYNDVKWVISGNLEETYDNINHEILLDFFKKKINDNRFVNFIRKQLKAGYFEYDKSIVKSFIKTPQQSLIGPILVNIYLHELDLYVFRIISGYETLMDNTIIQSLLDDETNKLYTNIVVLERKLQTFKAENKAYNKSYFYKELLQQVLSLKTKKKQLLPKQVSIFPIKVKYVRYAHNWLVGINGPKWIVEQITSKLTQFIKEKMCLELLGNEINITYIRKHPIFFLGYNLCINKTLKVKKCKDQKGNIITTNVMDYYLCTYLPTDRIIHRLSIKGICNSNGEPKSMTPWVGAELHDIVQAYNSIIDGLFTYYSHILNFKDLYKIQWILRWSCAKTIGHKLKISSTKVFAKYGKTLRVPLPPLKQIESLINTEQESFLLSRKLIQEKVCELHIKSSLKKNQKWFQGATNQFFDPFQVQINFRSKTTLNTYCAICLNSHNVEMHYVNHLRKDIKSKSFNQLLGMIKIKTIPICKECHIRINKSIYDNMKLTDLMDPKLLQQ
uniref:Putative reverse transcriptase and intron maturase n=1 Tax=Netrium digitus TaxID=43946 RepID=A0A191T584_9VIRI|nr:putative reverse transcriptase and intron maturase [Netrium digitus]ANI25549.1 putative reverse transcriptase and intron maturase [Netrium digitus]